MMNSRTEIWWNSNAFTHTKRATDERTKVCRMSWRKEMDRRRTYTHRECPMTNGIILALFVFLFNWSSQSHLRERAQKNVRARAYFWNRVELSVGRSTNFTPKQKWIKLCVRRKGILMLNKLRMKPFTWILLLIFSAGVAHHRQSNEIGVYFLLFFHI